MLDGIYFKEIEMRRGKAKGGYYHEGIILVDEINIKFSIVTNQNFYAENGKPDFLFGKNYVSGRFCFSELNVYIEDKEIKRRLEKKISDLINKFYEEQMNKQ